jgi:hypothetical protein
VVLASPARRQGTIRDPARTRFRAGVNLAVTPGVSVWRTWSPEAPDRSTIDGVSDQRAGRWQRLNEGMLRAVLRAVLRAHHPILYQRFGRTLDLRIERPRRGEEETQRARLGLSRKTEWLVMTAFVLCLVAGVATAGVLAVEGRPALAIGAVAAGLALAYALLTFAFAITLGLAHRRRRG